MTPNIERLTIRKLQTAYRRGDLTPVQVTEICLSRASQLNQSFGAFVQIDFDIARSKAEWINANTKPRNDLPLRGVPLAHKDIFAHPTRQPGCGVSRTGLSSLDLPPSPLLESLNAAGAIDLGPLSLAEFALGTTGSNARLGDAHNPWNLEYCTGASSSGSAVAVAAGFAFGSLGTDSGASIRTPAALCGVVGYMPEHQGLDSTGCFPLSWSVDRPGVLARTVEDCLALTSVLRGKLPPAPLKSHQNLKIGIPATYYNEGLTREIASAYDEAIRYFEELGHQVVEVPVVETVEMRSLHRAIMRTEAATIHREMLAEKPEFYDLAVRKFITGGEGIFAVDYVDALRLRGPLQKASREKTFSVCDVLLTPTTPTTALRYADIADASRPEIWQSITRLAHFTQPASYLGYPAISVPFSLSDAGLPIGFQLITPAEREAELMAAAQQFETHWTGQNLWPPNAA